MKFCRRELSSENTQLFLCKEGETEEGKQILVVAEENKERLYVKCVIQTCEDMRVDAYTSGVGGGPKNIECTTSRPLHSICLHI